MKTNELVTGSLKAVTKILVKSNSNLNSASLQKVIAEFLKENEKAELNQEMIGIMHSHIYVTS